MPPPGGGCQAAKERKNAGAAKAPRRNRFHKISSSLGALVRFREPVSVSRITSSIRTPSFPGSRNVPLQAIGNVRQLAGDPDTPLFLYCHSGARSRQAAAALQGMGYRKIRNLGGITAYRGKVER